MQTTTQPDELEPTVKKKTEKAEETVAGPQGFVFYTDGGHKVGMMGWGFHGYRYEAIKPKRGSGHATHTVTKDGYFPKAEKKDEVAALEYFDAFGCSQETGTNNLAELLAAKNALDKASEYDVREIIIKTDSEYLRKGLTEWSPHWVRNNWIRRDGTPVPNKEHWKVLLADYKRMSDANVKIKVSWVRGHNDNFGNTIADKLATVGLVNSLGGKSFVEVKKSVTEGYWKREIVRHPFFFHKSFFFNTLSSSHVKGEYYLGNFAKEDELFGTRDSDGAYSVVHMAKDEDVLELVRTYHTELSGDFDSIVKVRVESIFNHQIYNELLDYGRSALIVSSPSRLDLKTLDKQQFSREMKPALLSWRAIDNISALKAVLTNYRLGEVKDELCVTDITSTFYDEEKTEKKGVTTITKKLKPQFIVGFSKLSIQVKGRTRSGLIEFPATLVFGQDIADRNALKRLEAHAPKVLALTWSDAPDVFRYATVIESEGNYLVSAGMYSNTFYYEP